MKIPSTLLLFKKCEVPKVEDFAYFIKQVELFKAVSFVMGSQKNEFNGFVRGCGAIGAGNKFVISLFSAGGTIKVDDEEVTADRTGIKPA
jgi:hypothetical protein